MTEEFKDDLADGGGRKPEKGETIAIRNYLKRHNREDSVRKVLVEMQARNFVVSLATVARHLKGTGVPEQTKSETQAADTRVAQAARNNKVAAPQVELPKLTIEDCKADEALIPKLAALLAENNTSTQLAIQENRARMALNQVIAHMMAAKPELLLLDMRGTAALVDALTVAAKLSGGASIDITVPTDEERARALNGHSNGALSPAGHEMKDITPKSAVVTAIDNWRHGQKNGQGA